MYAGKAGLDCLRIARQVYSKLANLYAQNPQRILFSQILSGHPLFRAQVESSQVSR